MYKRKLKNGKEIYPISLITKKLKSAKSVIIIGKKWFDKINGNTYCSARLIVDGETIETSDYTYGYGDYWREVGTELLAKNGYIKQVVDEDNNNLIYKALYDFITKNDENRKKITYIDTGYCKLKELRAFCNGF